MDFTIIPFIKEILIILLGLFVFLVLKDKFYERKKLKKAVADRLLQIVVNPVFVPAIVIIILIAIYYIVYTLFFS